MARLASFALLLSISLPNIGVAQQLVAAPLELALPQEAPTGEVVPAVATAPVTTVPTKTPEPDNARIIRQLARAGGGDPAALAHLIQLSAEFDSALKAELIDELGAAHMRAGNLDLAAEARRVLIERLPDETRATQAALWLVRLYSSSEVAYAREQRLSASTDPARQFSLAPGKVVREGAAQEEPSGETGSKNTMAEYALHQATLATTARPELNDEPALAFQRSVAARLSGDFKKSQGFLSPVRHRRPGDVWGDCARMESWLQDGADRPAPKPVLACPVAPRPPRLDGKLNKLFWNIEQATAWLNDPTAPAPNELERSQVQLAHDSEFLYMAIICRKTSGVVYERDQRPREHDADLQASDRVRLLLDVDRDYASWFELAVDSSGRTVDRAWDDAGWNPQWFVAAADGFDESGETWIVEAAIPWSALAAQPPTSGEVWACAFERTAPGGKSQSWTGPVAADSSPGAECFGVIRFE